MVSASDILSVPGRGRPWITSLLKKRMPASAAEDSPTNALRVAAEHTITRPSLAAGCAASRGWTVQPDLQYWRHPGGGDTPVTLLGLVRVMFTF